MVRLDLEKIGFLFILKNKQWKRRWFILRHGILYKYRSHIDKYPTSQYIWNNGEISVQTLGLGQKTKDEKSFCFMVTHKKTHYFFAAETEDEMKEWVNAISGNNNQSFYEEINSSNNKILGISLEKINFQNENGLPIFLTCLMDYIEATALGKDDIFTKAPDPILISQIQEGILDFELIKNYHAVAGLIQVFLHEMPIPVLTSELRICFIGICEIKQQATKIQVLKSLCDVLPPYHYNLLRRLCLFLQNIYHGVENDKEKMMDHLINTFSILFLRQKEESISSSTNEVSASGHFDLTSERSLMNEVVRNLIIHCNQICPAYLDIENYQEEEEEENMDDLEEIDDLDSPIVGEIIEKEISEEIQSNIIGDCVDDIDNVEKEKVKVKKGKRKKKKANVNDDIKSKDENKNVKKTRKKRHRTHSDKHKNNKDISSPQDINEIDTKNDDLKSSTVEESSSIEEHTKSEDILEDKNLQIEDKETNITNNDNIDEIKEDTVEIDQDIEPDKEMDIQQETNEEQSNEIKTETPQEKEDNEVQVQTDVINDNKEDDVAKETLDQEEEKKETVDQEENKDVSDDKNPTIEEKKEDLSGDIEEKDKEENIEEDKNEPEILLSHFDRMKLNNNPRLGSFSKNTGPGGRKRPTRRFKSPIIIAEFTEIPEEKVVKPVPKITPEQQMMLEMSRLFKRKA